MREAVCLRFFVSWLVGFDTLGLNNAPPMQLPCKWGGHIGDLLRPCADTKHLLCVTIRESVQEMSSTFCCN